MLHLSLMMPCTWNISQSQISGKFHRAVNKKHVLFSSCFFSAAPTDKFSHFISRYQNSFYGVDLSNLRQAAVDEYFKQPIVVSSIC